MSARPVQITVSPVGEVLPRGVHHAVMRVYVVNTGSQPVSVKVSKTWVTSGAHGCTSIAPPSWLTVTPASMRLAPGKTQVATMTVNAPAGITGSYDLVAVFGATGKSAGPVKLTDSIGTQMVIRTGRAVIPHCGRHVAAATPYHPAGGLPAADIGAASGIVVILAVAAAFTARSVRKRRAQGRLDHYRYPEHPDPRDWMP